jgi:outer membrane receptor for ferrienterochelin and colicin
VNFPEAEIDGVESEFQWLIAEDWEFTSSVAWNESEISKTSTLFARSNFPFTVVEGTPLPLSPELKVSAGLQYTLPFTLWGTRPYLKLDYSYAGESYNSVGSEAVIVGAPPQRQDDYALVDFAAGLDRWGKRRLSINDPRAFGVSFRKNF